MRVQNWEQLHSLSKHLIKWWGEGKRRKGALKAKHLQETAELRGTAQLNLFAAVLEIKRQGTEAKRIPDFNGATVLTASRLQLCSPTSFLMAGCRALAQQHPGNSGFAAGRKAPAAAQREVRRGKEDKAT